MRGQQEHHGRPLNRLKPPLIDQVDDDRQSNQWQSPQQPGLQKAHRIPFA